MKYRYDSPTNRITLTLCSSVSLASMSVAPVVEVVVVDGGNTNAEKAPPTAPPVEEAGSLALEAAADVVRVRDLWSAGFAPVDILGIDRRRLTPKA